MGQNRFAAGQTLRANPRWASLPFSLFPYRAGASVRALIRGNADSGRSILLSVALSGWTKRVPPYVPLNDSHDTAL
jgi:hypothetical protein